MLHAHATYMHACTNKATKLCSLAVLLLPLSVVTRRLPANLRVCVLSGTGTFSAGHRPRRNIAPFREPSLCGADFRYYM